MIHKVAYSSLMVAHIVRMDEVVRLARRKTVVTHRKGVGRCVSGTVFDPFFPVVSVFPTHCRSCDRFDGKSMKQPRSPVSCLYGVSDKFEME
jgi:hypothetical protein